MLKSLKKKMKGLKQFGINFIIYFIILISSVSFQAQLVSVSGKVISDRIPVSDVFISFIDISDTTLQYSALMIIEVCIK